MSCRNGGFGVGTEEFLFFCVTRYRGFPTSSSVKASRRRWSMALRAVLLAHSSLIAFCIEIHFGLPTLVASGCGSFGILEDRLRLSQARPRMY